MAETADTPGVIAPPPLIALAAVLVGVALDWLAPAYLLTLLLTMTERIVIGLILIAAGCALPIAARRMFISLGTHVNPFKPASALATTGVYAYVRNPMYVGLGLLVAGIGIALASDWTLVMLVAAALIIHVGVVKREERYLMAKFGDAYQQYMQTVPRYGVPF